MDNDYIIDYIDYIDYVDYIDSIDCFRIENDNRIEMMSAFQCKTLKKTKREGSMRSSPQV